MRRAQSADAFEVSPAYGRWVVGLLFGAQTFEIFGRQVLALVLEPMGADLGLSDAGRGSLITAYAICYGLAGPVLARLADRRSRRALIAGCVAASGALLGLCGLAGGHASLLLARAGLGAANSGGPPAGASLLSDYVPPERRGVALGLVGSGGHVGTLLGLGAWGLVAANYGWRAAFLSAGAVGLAYAALLALSLREPPRGWSEARQSEAAEQPALRTVLTLLWGLRSFRHVTAGILLGSMATMAGGQWNPAFFMRVHELPVGTAGPALAIVSGLVGASSIALGGVLADRLVPRDPRWYVRLPALGMLCAAPLLAAAYLWPAPLGAFAFLGMGTVGLMLFAAPTATLIQALVPLRMRAVAASLTIVLGVVLGLGLGPWITGQVSDAFAAAGSAEGLRYALVASVGLVLWSALHFALAARHVTRELAPRADA